MLLSTFFGATASAERLHRLRDARLREIVAYAYGHTAYYRRLLDSAGVRPEHIKGVSDLRLVPPTSREALQEIALEEFLPGGTARGRRVSTSGSTGRPVTAVWTRTEGRVQRLITWREMQSNGARPGWRMARFYLRGDTSRPPGLALARLGLHLASFNIKEPPEALLPLLQRLRPHLMYGVASYFAMLARAALDRGIKISPRLVVTSADTLTDQARLVMGQAFGCDPIEVYSCVETGDMAWHCRARRRLHVNSDLLWLEVLREDGTPAEPGEPGDLTCTSLYHYGMPRIRYQPGDIGSMSAEPCECGLAHPCVAELSGRKSDLLRLPDGRMITPIVLAYLFFDYPRTQAYRFLQEGQHRLVIEVVPGSDLPADDLEKVRRKAFDVLGGQLDVEVRVVATIPRVGLGKQVLASTSGTPPPTRHGQGNEEQG